MFQARFERDADLLNDTFEVSTIPTNENRFEISCSLCNGHFFTTQEQFERIERAAAMGQDNPFVCDGCIAGYEAARRGF